MLFPLVVQAKAIGIRFVVADILGQTVMQRQAVQATLEKRVGELNGYYRNSDVVLQAEIVDVAFSPIIAVVDVEILDDMAHERRGFENLFERASEYGADYTIAMVSKLLIFGKRGCGRAFAVNKTVVEISSTRRALAVIDYACEAHTLAHELGHLMGLNHGALIDRCEPGKGHTTAVALYANGYGEGNCDGKPQPGEFGDIMVGGWMRVVSGDDKSSLRIYSNPRIRDKRCGASGVCGDPEIGDAARVLNENARYYTAHEEPSVHTLHYASMELRECILEKYRGKKIAELHELACPHAGIGSVAGVERLTALRRIDLSGNSIVDASLLSQLPGDQVERLDLTGNNGVSCQSIERLVGHYGWRLVRPASCRLTGAGN